MYCVKRKVSIFKLISLNKEPNPISWLHNPVHLSIFCIYVEIQITLNIVLIKMIKRHKYKAVIKYITFI